MDSVAPRERVLVVEDDPEINAMVAGMLAERGYEVLSAGDGRDMERLLNREQLDLVILDLMLPGEDGVSLCRRLRTRFGVPILMLTAIGGETDRIVGLESGADDYLVKPFAPRELLARVRALLRRTGRHTAPAPETPAAYDFAGWELNLVRLSLTLAGRRAGAADQCRVYVAGGVVRAVRRGGVARGFADPRRRAAGRGL